ncbi:hypothetical protein QWY14_04175 [Planococcus sp. N028]|uniref:Lipoprotein n=1 Tax=Planococcus shixiaomingii TaxID=3058393 RepID=A0ABT8MZB0_9BACL|nr:hypothetical protein [Planococcus sp. N028]MDN7240971.1 hypothetical protein [Planococcus sp. N028]
MRSSLILLVCLLFILTGCKEDKQLSGDASTASDYLENMGYEIVSLTREDSILLQEHHLTDPGYEQIWKVQPFKPASYVDEEIAVVEFEVDNHPLEEVSDEKTTIVTVYLNKGEVIGGWSFPKDPYKALGGGVYSIDGRTMEEVQGEK